MEGADHVPPTGRKPLTLPNMSNVVMNSCDYFFSTYGWPILLTLLALYLGRDHIRKFLNARSLASANDPTRRKILDEEKKKARMRQQLDLMKAYRESNDTESGGSKGGGDKKEKKQRLTSLSLGGSGTSGGGSGSSGSGRPGLYNPLGGG